MWHPLGVVGVISAFNFPVAVWSWNAAVALVCGDTVVWKPSELAPLTALATSSLLARAVADVGAPPAVGGLLLGGRDVGEVLVDSRQVALVSATGSTRMGREVGPRVAARFGRVLLELGGNNAVVLAPSADLDLAVNSMVFAAAGTAGQRCTSLRRLIVHSSVADEAVARLARAYESLPVGDPSDPATLVGPLITERAFDAMQEALEEARMDGGEVVAGGERVDVGDGGCYVRPALVRMPAQTPVVLRETFAPILYVVGYDDLDEALALHNAASQGLSAGIFTRDQAEAERVPRHRRHRHRQRQCRHLGRRDRRGLRRREGDRRRTRVRLGRLARLHAPLDQHDQLLRRRAARAGRAFRLRTADRARPSVKRRPDV